MEGATGPIQDVEVTSSSLADYIDSRPTVDDNPLHMLTVDVEGEDREMFIAQIGVYDRVQ